MRGYLKNKLKKFFIRERIVPVNIPIQNYNLLNGKCAIVTGGSSGIGFGIAKKLSESGCSVIIVGTNEEKLQNRAKEINAEYLVLNIKSVSDIEDKFGQLLQLHKIDILVNSAGIHCEESFGKISEKVWNDVFDINLKGLYFVSQTIANHMIKKNIHGHILNISSASSLKPSWTPYEISKKAINGITQGMAHKLISHGIIVNGIAPGPTATPMLHFDAQNDIDLTWDGNPSGRVSTIDEIANLAIFLVSDLGAGIVGDTIFLSGGSGTICIDK